jgi:hypothetical protein
MGIKLENEDAMFAGHSLVRAAVDMSSRDENFPGMKLKL